MNVLEVRNLTKSYRSFVLSDISFNLEKGKITGFAGRNGAGKTTTIKSVLGLVHADSGTVSFFGIPFSENEREIKQRIGFSTGAVNYYPKKKIGVIAEVTKTFYNNWDEKSYREYLKKFSLDEEKRPCELSEGMKVKFNLLLALSHNAEILILDEPTSGLDPFSRDEIMNIFSELKNRGVSVLFSTHIISDIEKSADDIIYIRNGKIAADCSKKGFIENYCMKDENIEDAILRMEKEGDT